ncbi:Aste57867_23546 [Aphanomyces stellatus]|uniref:Aste57867_23546 protein n=1 Tax=Aphanomyces stellatus TaxID=120398 RepID=A0A485LMY2_9STRA|nr:hypothetical protein As57867_023475 [Aphanomyces stellatus]VFU00191.1 Aste57867_23546 [Aphanomyces stellatus]
MRLLTSPSSSSYTAVSVMSDTPSPHQVGASNDTGDSPIAATPTRASISWRAFELCVVWPASIAFAMFRKDLSWKHEQRFIALVRAMQFREANFYLTHVKRFDELVAATTEHEMDKPLRALVKAQIEGVSKLIDGGKTFIAVKDTMSLGSVVVSTVFFVAYWFYFWHQGFVIGNVNSKVHDALAIVLPLLLTEELAVGLSQGLLWCHWLLYTRTHDVTAIHTRPSTSPHRATLQTQKMVFDRRVSHQCLGVGVGAKDMTGLSALIASLWTFCFLIQGYIAEVQHIQPANAWMTPTYWFIVVYSGGLVTFCYLPFFIQSSEAQKEVFESVATSCESYLLLQHLSQLQDQIATLLTHDHQLPSAVAYPAIRRLRQQVAHQLDTDALVSYALYIMALSTYNFFTGQVGDVALDTLTLGSSDREPNHAATALDPINQRMSYYWGASLGEVVAGGAVDGAFPTFSLRVPPPTDEADAIIPDEMTLTSMPVLGHQTFHDLLIQRNLTSMSAIFDNPLVQEKKIYMPPHDDTLVAIGLEVKIMEHYTVSIYMVAERGATFGRGRVYVTAAALSSMVRLKPHVVSETLMVFVEVAEEDQLRAFATCTLEVVDPRYVAKPFKRSQSCLVDLNGVPPHTNVE